eukprot:GEZU01026262.1.p2 GENE.GEZU01026262.1~~GEZU01026262.1.p2  ORF type:complete len:120 (+),score=20.02 GEZU01026262.1:100-459(+)
MNNLITHIRIKTPPLALEDVTKCIRSINRRFLQEIMGPMHEIRSASHNEFSEWGIIAQWMHEGKIIQLAKLLITGFGTVLIPPLGLFSLLLRPKRAALLSGTLVGNPTVRNLNVQHKER